MFRLDDMDKIRVISLLNKRTKKTISGRCMSPDLLFLSKSVKVKVGLSPYPDVMRGQMESHGKLLPLLSFLKTARLELARNQIWSGWFVSTLPDLPFPQIWGFQLQWDIFSQVKISIGNFFYPNPPIRSCAEQFLELLLLITENPTPPRLHFSFIRKRIFFGSWAMLQIRI